MYKIIKI